MNEKKRNVDHKVVTTETDAPSTSAKVTIESSGTVGDDSNSLFPQFQEEKEWSSKTDNTIDLKIDRNHKDIL